jgi:threonine dehydratase
MIDRPRLDEIRDAAVRLNNVTVRTPLVPLHSFDDDTGILLKPEILQSVRSFKIRGIYNAVVSMTPEERSSGLSTVSAGNTAQALAWCGRHFGVAARSVMPETAPGSKIEAVRRYGGEAVLVPTAEVFRFLKEHLWENEPYAFVHPWTNRDVMVGHGTIGLEIVADFPGVKSVYVPVGGGGLIGGVGSALKALRPEIRVVAVEPEGCPALHESFRRGAASSVECETICDGVAVPYITEEMYPLLRDVVDEVVLVPEREVRAMIRRLALRDRMVVEGSAALSVAAALAAPRERRAGSVCLVTGGSIGNGLLRQILGEVCET